MTEEDEIDILGDFSLDNLLSKNENEMFDTSNLVSQNTDLLNCDYTIHPQWLLDKPSANPACWYNTTNSDFSTTLSNEDSSNFSLEQTNAIENIAEAPAIDESGWTEKERDLLKRGIEIFGKSHIRLTQFIGSKSASEVKHFLKNYYTDDELICTNSVENEIVFDNVSEVVSCSKVLDDAEIPASIEEVIASVTTGKPTVNNRTKRKLLKKTCLLKNQHLLKHKTVKIRKSNVFTDNETHSLKKHVKFKFKANVKIPQKMHKIKAHQFQSKSESAEVTNVAEIVTGVGLSVPLCTGEEVIKIQKENQDSESDVDIEIEDTVDVKNATVKIIKQERVSESEITESPELNTECAEKIKDKDLKTKKMPDLNDLDDDVKDELNSLKVPHQELELETNFISKLEKAIHYEFFEDRPTKTPSRYLKIRNHILSMWAISKPSYVTKTSIRKGLQQCGDVNCIGRIHTYLEQIGAINFGCVQTSYIRPLSEIIHVNVPKEKISKEQENIVVKLKIDSQRPRFKSKSLNNGEGGCTITHNEKGDIINTTVINEDPVPQKVRAYVKKPVIKLVYCRPFTDQNPQQFTINLHLSTLILMDLHAHMSLNEVMGLVGGIWNAKEKVLTISRYEPCKNIAPSSTHCDMCPITQANAANILHGENLEILGWFHSHPTFAPEPSHQDLETQLSVQQWIGNNKPCIGIILSPFSLHGALIASPYRCMIVDKKEHFEDQFVPYRFKVDLVSKGIDVEVLLNRAWRIFNVDCKVKEESRVNFGDAYFQDGSLTHLDKFVSSIKMHLAKCTDINKMTCDAIVEGLSNVCCKRSL